MHQAFPRRFEDALRPREFLADLAEGPRHYLNCEVYGGPAAVPLREDAAQAMLGPDAFQKTGQVPWVVLDRVQSLAEAFGSGDPHRVAKEASFLCHYAADLNVPLHTTVNHNGDDTGQHGVHGRWETGLLERIVDREGWTPEVRPAELGPDPQAAPLAWLAESFARVPGVLADDLSATKSTFRHGVDPGEAYWAAFLERQEPNVKECLTLSGQRTAQMILLAWNRAGRPLVH